MCYYLYHYHYKALCMVTAEAVQYSIRGNQTILCEKHMKNNDKKETVGERRQKLMTDGVT